MNISRRSRSVNDRTSVFARVWSLRWGMFAPAPAAMIFALAGCASIPERSGVPESLSREAHPVGFKDVRVVIDPFSSDFSEIRGSLAGAAAALADRSEEPVTLLAISGGGSRGAWGAGVLNGWSEKGDRPQFDIVAGISTGALIAPFAFLGSQFDEELKLAYTTVTDADVVEHRSLYRILRSRDALAGSGPLLDQLFVQMTEEKMTLIAAEHAKGRRLYVGTTDLDGQVLVAWDVGAIASSGLPGTRELFCRVLLASASIPGVFPPVMIDAEARGRIYQEMHVDGGMVTQVFGFAILGHLMDMSGRRDGRIFLLRNAFIAPQWKEVSPSVASLAGRAVSTLIKTQGVGDVYRAYLIARENGIDFNLCYIPLEVDPGQSEGHFDPEYMGALFDAGRESIHAGTAWLDQPPGVDLLYGPIKPANVNAPPDS